LAARSKARTKPRVPSPPPAEALPRALRACYNGAGLRQVDVVERIQDSGNPDIPPDFITQPKLSRWSTGRDRPPLDALPVLEAVCGRPIGSILHAAGYVADVVPSVAHAIAMDPALSPDAKRMLLASYEAMTRESGRDGAAAR
jgi:hypothetical protein